MLSFQNAFDFDNDPVTYETEIYLDSLLLLREWRSTSAVTSGSTSYDQVTSPLLENVRHWWRVRATDGYKFSPWSALQTFRMNAVEEKPHSFFLNSPTAGNTVYSLTPTLNWSAANDPDPGDVMRYKVEVSITPNFSFKFVKDSLLTNSCTIEDTLLPGARYYWRVTVSDKTGKTAACVPSSSNFLTWELGDIDHSGATDIADLTRLVGYLFVDFDPIVPLLVGDLNGDCSVDIVDLTLLVDHLFIRFSPLGVGCD